MSAHERYRTRLSALAMPAAVDGMLNCWCASRGGAPAERWSREYGRFRPGAEPWAVLALRGHTSNGMDGETVRLDVHDARPGAEAVEVDGVGWAVVRAASEDEALPGLHAVLDSVEDARVVRYRPGSRCTLSGVTRSGRRFVKVAPGAERLQADARLLWAATTAGALPFAIAEPCGWHRATSSSWYGVVAGEPIAAHVLGVDGGRVAAQLGRALGAFARLPLRPVVVEAPAVQLARTAGAVARAERVVPELSGELRTMLASLAERHEHLASQEPVPVHGAPHLHQWLDDEGRLGLVDFDRLALGEPELDLATFLAELDAESERLLPINVLEAAIVAGFEETGPALDPVRLDLYRAHKRLSKVARTACSPRPDGDVRAARHLAALASESH